MKKNVIFAISMLAAAFAFGQNRNVEEVKDTAPQFTGVENAIKIRNGSSSALIADYLKEKVEFKTDIYAEGIEVVQFTVTAQGNVADFKIINSVSPNIDSEIIRVLENTNGMWLPGYSNGKPVDMTKEVTLAVCFETESSKLVSEIFKEKATNFFNAATTAFVANKNPKKAIKYYNRSANYLPNDQSLLLMRGLCRFELGDNKGAHEDWNRMISLGGNIDMSEYSAQIAEMKGYNELIENLSK